MAADTLTEELTADTGAGTIELRRLRKQFGGHEVIHGVDLSVQSGEFCVFVGPSGCGKSTLLRLIAGLEDVSSGDVWIGGEDVTDNDPSKRGIAMVFQSYALYPHMTVRENLGFGLSLERLPKAQIAERVEAAAQVLDISPLLDRRPAQLSGGQRQRVAIGRAIVRKPRAFLFDEPLSNLDAELRVGMRVEIARLHRELGNTVIYVTHDQTEAMTLADRIVVLRSGRIEQVGTPRQLYEDPDNSFVAGFIGSPRMNFLRGEWRNGQAWIGGQGFPVNLAAPPADGAAIDVGLRPEHLSVSPSGEGAPGLSGTVELSEYLGGTQFVHLTLADGSDVSAEYRGKEDFSPGQAVTITPVEDAVRIFDANGQRMR
ncbi:ABC transporter ATP-binding protein [Pelagovum pacificum]|uniref:sn-glycerol-3-phosphate ABC transporter ATP-binding protein UgpC n=1 Tax=Pelagovum pacificum TaxID=2588711 RepID=A0A5C5GAK1_9RHOB|nr:sn-glycerol-3-phosphate ABC transporter ATP-binding protein UgpC [Pelagovum pacificum]QQA41714.1 sn-glycerol-3-phosphate ABC transporter ATP-binding protein UgpC [Pelagovum pacificum]TNY30990.1 sn-glycerol-3-phosphate ABC transporter ATP-binding protein UgpC [Pelagovum pacificum]